MTTQHWQLIIQIVVAFGTIFGALLTAIYRELRSLNTKFQAVMIQQVKLTARIDSAEKVIYSLPCVNQPNCPRETV